MRLHKISYILLISFLEMASVLALSFHINLPYAPSFSIKPDIVINGKYAIVNVNISQLDSEYYPNCTLYLFVLNKTFNAVVFRYSKTMDFAFHQTKNIKIKIPIYKYKRGKYYLKWYLSCGGYPIIGNVQIMHFLSANPLGLMILQNYGGYIEFMNENNGSIPSAYIDKKNFSVSGSFSQFAPLVSINKILLDMLLRGVLQNGYLVVEQCDLFGKCEVLKRFNNITFNGSMRIKDFIPLKDTTPNYIYYINVYIYNKNGELEDFWNDKICLEGREPHVMYSYLNINKTFVVFAGPIDPNYKNSTKELAQIVVYIDNDSKSFKINIPSMKKDGFFTWSYPYLVNKVCVYLPYERKCFQFNTTSYVKRVQFAEKLYKELMGSSSKINITQNISISAQRMKQSVNMSNQPTTSAEKNKNSFLYILLILVLILTTILLIGFIFSKRKRK